MKFKKIILLPMLLLCGVAYAGDGTRDDVESVDKYRFGVDLNIKLAKGLKLNISPEMRFDGGFDEFLINSGVSYKTFGCIYWGIDYRLVCDRELLGSVTTGFTTRNEYGWDYLHRYALDVAYKESFGRLTPSFRLRYNDYLSMGDSALGELRYRAKLEYDIKKCRFSPEISAEAFQSEKYDYMFSKMRYSVGVEYKVNKRVGFALDYKLDYYLLEYKNAHIFTLAYKRSL